METAKKLKTCPFCGGRAELSYCEDEYWVTCLGEDCEICPQTACHHTAEKAVAAWNKREE
jgi:hypothetical protein